MIKRFKSWIEGVVRQEMEGPKVMPHVIANGAPFIQIYRIGNGYIFYKNDHRQYREDNPNTVIYCATPLEVARHIVNTEALEKLGVKDQQEKLPMQTHGNIAGTFASSI